MPPSGDYYLTNLEHLLGWVATHHAPLLDPPAQGFIRQFGRLPVAARRLYVRLLLRRGPLFRADRLVYAEVDSVPDALLALALAGFASVLGRDDWQARLGLLTMPELRELYAGQADGAPSGASRKSELLAACKALGPKIASALPGAVRLEGGEDMALLRLLFFGNPRQDLVEYILADLNVLRFEPVAAAPEFAWQTAADVRSDLALHQCASRVGRWKTDETVTLKELRGAHRILRTAGIDALTERRRSRALLRLSVCWRRAGYPARALACLQAASTPPAREQLCRGLARAGAVERARAVLAAMREAPRDASETRFAARFDPARGRCLPRPRHCGILRSRLVLGRCSHGTPIEEQVAGVLAGAGAWALHLENLPIRALVGLAFWEVIFAPAPGAFVQPFQSGPRDLFDPQFRRLRQAALEDRLEAVADGRHGAAELFATWRQ